MSAPAKPTTVPSFVRIGANPESHWPHSSFMNNADVVCGMDFVGLPSI